MALVILIGAHAVTDGDAPMKLALDALDRWVEDLGHEENELRTQLRAAQAQLTRS